MFEIKLNYDDINQFARKVSSKETRDLPSIAVNNIFLDLKLVFNLQNDH